MAIGGVLAQAATSDDLREVLIEAYVPQAVALVLVLVAAVLLIKVLPRREGGGSGPGTPIPDWYDDPWGEPYQRWWNGAEWTPAVRPHPWPGPPAPGGSPPGGPPAGPPPA